MTNEHPPGAAKIAVAFHDIEKANGHWLISRIKVPRIADCRIGIMIYYKFKQRMVGTVQE